MDHTQPVVPEHRDDRFGRGLGEHGDPVSPHDPERRDPGGVPPGEPVEISEGERSISKDESRALRSGFESLEEATDGGSRRSVSHHI